MEVAQCQICQSAASIWICHPQRMVCCIKKCSCISRSTSKKKKEKRKSGIGQKIDMREEKVTSSHHPGGMNCLQDCWSLLSLILSCLILPNMIIIHAQLLSSCNEMQNCSTV